MQNETGRSLVETLGVLAIIGVLSVAGIAGFNHAMDKTKANTIINEAQKRATLVVPQILLMNNSNPTITEFVNNDFGYGTFDTTVYTKSNLNAMPKNAFAIKVSNVPKNVCRNILNTIGEKTPIRRLSLEETPTLPMTECQNTNSFLMIYNDDMLGENKNPPQSCHSHTDCGECGTCKKENEDDETGVCVGECESACSTQDECGENDCVICDDEAKTCQNKCVEVEWLGMDTMSYINSGYSGNSNNIRIETKFNTTITRLYAPIFGNANEETQNNWGLIRGTYGYFNSQRSLGKGCPNYKTDGSWNSVEMYRTNNTGYCIVNNSSGIHTNLNNSNGTMNDDPICIGCAGINRTTTGSSPVRFGYFKIWDNGALVRDFIPVLSPQIGEEERKACMFDKVSKKLFCNSGSGTFDYGPK